MGGAKFHMAKDNKGSVEGGFAELEIGSSGVKIVYYDEQASVLYTTGTLGPRSPPSPTPPTPPPPPSSWDCRTNKKATIGSDTNLKYTGDDRSSCTDACEGRSNCVAVYWHKTDSHCHVLEGSFDKTSWEGELSSNGDYDSCFNDGSMRATLVWPGCERCEWCHVVDYGHEL